MENPVIIRHSELLNRPVFERDTMQEMGRVERLWMYPQAHRVMGLVCRSGRFGGKRFVYKLPQLDSLGKENLWVNGAPTETTGEQIRRLESLMDHEIWVDGGDRLGVIIDCMFNRKTGAITQYLFVNNPLRRLVGDPFTLPPSEIKGFGNRRVLVEERSLQRLSRERPGLKETLQTVRDQAREEYSQVSEEVRAAQQQAAERAAERAEMLRQQASEFRHQASEFRHQASEQAQTWQQRFSEQAQTWGQRLGEQARELSRELREQTEEMRSGEWGEVPELDAPDEVTWVDEAGELPPARSPQRSPQGPTRPRQTKPHPRTAHNLYQNPSQNGPQTQANQPVDQDHGEQGHGDQGYDDRWVSRENPWGYEDGVEEARPKQWSDAPPEAFPDAFPDAYDRATHTTDPSEHDPSEHDPSEQDSGWMNQVSDEDLDDEDPWV